MLYRGSLKRDAVTSWAPPWRGGGALAYNDKAVSRLMERARDGDADADAVLRDIASDILKAGVLLRIPLANYIVDVLGKPASKASKPGPKPNALKVRNRYIADAVDRVTKLGFKPYRNQASRSDHHPASACSIVAKALTALRCSIGEDGVEKIVRRVGRDKSKRRKN